MSLDKETYNHLRSIENKAFLSDDLDENIKNTLLKAKVIVGKSDDDNYVVQKKYVKYRSNFNSNALGLVIVPTCECNFACPYCYEKDLFHDRMSEDVENGIISFIKSSKESDNLQICWHGGEPLLAFNTIKRILIKIKKDDQIKLNVHSMVTNGYLMDEEKCIFFKEHKLGSVQITIDGLPETHNNSRKHKSGINTYDVIINNIETVFKIMPDCHVIVRMNVYNENKDDCPILYKELSERWKGNNFSIVMVYATDHGECKVACMKDKQRVNFARELTVKHDIKNINFYPYTQLGGCTADNVNSYIIGPKGELYKCWVDVGKEERVIGHINEDRINLGLVSEYIVGTDMFNDEKCQTCFLLPVCDGGCGLFRLEHKLNDKPYNVCPIDPLDIVVLLDTFYEQKILNLW
jgi:uncharacterized protein